MGFGPADHMTWKARYPASQVCDELDPSWESPLSRHYGYEIALIFGANKSFILEKCDSRADSIKRFLEPIEIFKKITVDTSSSFNFLVLTMPATVLHDLVFTHLVDVISGVLNSKYRSSVSLRLVSLPDHAIPQNRKVLVLVVSPLFGPAPWKDIQPDTVTVESLIKDLASSDPRAKDDRRTSFAYRGASTESGGSQIIYNHQTGSRQGDSIPINLDTNALPNILSGGTPLAHPIRGDLLTVRELARIQGFPDDFIFYQSLSSQYKQVMEAFPPSISKMAAEAIMGIILELRCHQTDEKDCGSVDDDSEGDDSADDGARGRKRRWDEANA